LKNFKLQDPALGATIITGVAFLADLVLTLTVRATGSPITFTTQSLYLVMLVRLAAACADFVTLSAYASGLNVTSAGTPRHGYNGDRFTRLATVSVSSIGSTGFATCD
jgi:hypothetical protein